MSPIEKIHHHLIKEEKTLALAESCTGGLLAAKFTAIPDASKYFLGSLVTYSNALKKSLLKVSPLTISGSGSVSRAAADEMLLGLMKITDADYGIAVTGIAGPSGGTKEKPVGTVFIALGARGKKPHVIECTFTGDRASIMHEACERAILELKLLLDLI
ncbi:MAG: CinA family protein [Verrucomicrobia bacterium]|nr:CinA family protein [Verrucomicrobiota bacterium]